MLAAQKASTERHPKGDGGHIAALGLSTNETLFLSASGWEPVDICSGAAVFGMRRGHGQHLGLDTRRASVPSTGVGHGDCRRAPRSSVRESGAHGVIGTEIITEIEPRYVADQSGRNGDSSRPHARNVPGRAFTSNLSAREFVLLREAGWQSGRPGIGMSVHQGLSAQTHAGGRPKDPERRVREPDAGPGPSTIRDHGAPRRASTRFSEPKG